MNVQNETKPYDEINITPMLDLSYVLLIIFIIMCTAGVEGLKINLPRASTTPPTGPVLTKTITLTKDGKIILDRTPQASLAQLEQSLRALKQRSFAELPVVLRAEGEIPYQNVLSVLDVLDRLSIKQVGVATRSSRG
ncbi:MAG: ExbD/TolR family protein [Verrucomicrobiia bacterium]